MTAQHLPLSVMRPGPATALFKLDSVPCADKSDFSIRLTLLSGLDPQEQSTSARQFAGPSEAPEVHGLARIKG